MYVIPLIVSETNIERRRKSCDKSSDKLNL